MYNYTVVDICEYQFIMIIDQDLFNVFTGEDNVKIRRSVHKTK